MKKNKLLKSNYLGILEEKDVAIVCNKIKENSRISKAELKRFGLM